jgi:hypothetical protein
MCLVFVVVCDVLWIQVVLRARIFSIFGSMVIGSVDGYVELLIPALEVRAEVVAAAKTKMKVAVAVAVALEPMKSLT